MFERFGAALGVTFTIFFLFAAIVTAAKMCEFGASTIIKFFSSQRGERPPDE